MTQRMEDEAESWVLVAKREKRRWRGSKREREREREREEATMKSMAVVKELRMRVVLGSQRGELIGGGWREGRAVKEEVGEGGKKALKAWHSQHQRQAERQRE